MGAKRVTIEICVGANTTMISKIVETTRRLGEPTTEELNKALYQMFEDARSSIIKEN